MSAEPQRYLINIDEFYYIAEKHEDKRLELIEGEIIDMGKIGNKHAGCVDSLNYMFTLQVGKTARVRVQNPVRLSDISEPQPDLSINRFREDFYREAHPTSDDVLLLIEVADSSLKTDRENKVPLYALYKIPEVWLVDLTSHTVTVYREPQPQKGYTNRHHFYPGEQLVPHQLPHVKIAVSEIFGL